MTTRVLVLLPSLALAGCTIITQPPPGPAPAPKPTAAPAPASPAAQPRPAATPAPVTTPATTPAATTPTARPAQTAATPAPATPRPTAQPVATAKAPEKPAPITSVDVDVYNNCKTAIDYCVDDGSQLYTFASSNSHSHHTVRPGAKIRYRKSNNCTDVVYVVTDESPSQKANLCK